MRGDSDAGIRGSFVYTRVLLVLVFFFFFVQGGIAERRNVVVFVFLIGFVGADGGDGDPYALVWLWSRLR